MSTGSEEAAIVVLHKSLFYSPTKAEAEGPEFSADLPRRAPAPEQLQSSADFHTNGILRPDQGNRNKEEGGGRV